MNLQMRFIELKIVHIQKTSNDGKGVKCPLKWWKKYESMFPFFNILVGKMLGIMGSQIENGRIFSLVGILTNLT